MPGSANCATIPAWRTKVVSSYPYTYMKTFFRS